MTSETLYEFGTIIETVDGKEFHLIASEECDSDAQAELTAKQLADDPETYDLTDMDGEPVTFIHIRRGDVQWGISI